MGTLLSFSNIRNRYIAFIVWGIFQGIVIYLILIFLGTPYEKLDNATICILTGTIVSAVVFSLLSKVSLRLQTIGFLIVGVLLPYIVMIIWGLLARKTLEIMFPPLDTLFAFLWTICSLPFAIIAAALYLFLTAKSKRNYSKKT